MIEFIANPIYLKMLYPDGLSLSGSFISGLHFSYNGPDVNIPFHTKHLPLSPPAKWPEFNTVSIELQFIDIEDLSLTKWGTQNHITFECTKSGNSLSVKLSGADCDLSFKTKWIYCKSVNPYLMGEEF